MPSLYGECEANNGHVCASPTMYIMCVNVHMHAEYRIPGNHLQKLCQLQCLQENVHEFSDLVIQLCIISF